MNTDLGIKQHTVLCHYLLRVVGHLIELGVRLVPAVLCVPGVAAPSPWHVPVQIYKGHKHVIDRICDDDVVIDGHHTADCDHAPADTCGNVRH